jgi:hypothetical protein
MTQDDTLERAMADLEMLLAAYPDEIHIGEGVLSQDTASASSSQFPLHATLRLSATARIDIQFTQGYPVTSNLQIASYRSRPDDKSRMEEAVSAMRSTASQCLDDGVEGAFACVSAALEVWNSHGGGAWMNDHESLSGVAVDDAQTYTDPSSGEPSLPLQSMVDSANTTAANYTWNTGEPLHDRKSTFVAHVCRLYREADVRPALQQLLDSNSKLHKATHNMVRCRQRYFCVTATNYLCYLLIITFITVGLSDTGTST